MQSGDLLTSDVMAFESRILVNGVERSGKWSIDRSLAGDLPAQVVAGAGITQAEGTIGWAKEADVPDREIHPWSRTAGWPPSSGDRVEIYAGDGVSEWKVFKGRIDETTGDVGSGMESSVLDDYDRLDVRFSHEPLTRIMPPLSAGEPDMGIGLSSLYYVDAALRRAGFYATPAMEPRPILSVPAQTSLWPEVSIMTSGVVGGVDGGSWANRYDAPWGIAMGNFLSTYSPALQYPMSERTQWTMMVAPDHNGDAFFTAFYGTHDISFSVASSRIVYARLDGVEVCSLFMGEATIVTLSVSAGVWTLRNNAGGLMTGTAAYPTTATMDSITLKADSNSRVAGFQASHYSTDSYGQSLNHVPTVDVWTDTFLHTGITDAIPAIKPTTVIELLKEISAATLTGMWIDEHGVFQWAPSVNLRNQEPGQTITTLDDIRTLSWQDSLLSVRAGVEIDYRQPAITVHRWDNVLWYQGSGESLEAGETLTTFIEPDADTDWIRISSDLSVVGTPGSGTAANRGRGSVTGAMLVDGENELSFTDALSATLEEVTPGTLKMVHTLGSLSGDQHAVLQYPSEVASVAYRFWGEHFPIIRGFGEVKWATMTLASTIKGPFWAPVLVHDAGPWNARENETFVLERILEYLAEQVTKPSPSITGMRVGFDPRRQLGDVIRIVSERLLGLELTALIVDLQNSADRSYTQTLGVRIITAKSTYTTHEQFNDAGVDLTHDQWQLLEPLLLTYDEFNTQSTEVA